MERERQTEKERERERERERDQILITIMLTLHMCNIMLSVNITRVKVDLYGHFIYRAIHPFRTSCNHDRMASKTFP